MLAHISIQDLAVVEALELEFKPGLTVLTGETGAGKSILIDALSLTLGERADSRIIRPNCPYAEISATYDLSTLPLVLTWLKEEGLDSEEKECIIRRVLSKDGRSRAYINGHLVPLTQIKELGERLLNIHGQHQHQSLLKSEYQRLLLDEYANHAELSHAVKTNYLTLQHLCNEYKEILAQQKQADKLALLQQDELLTLETTHKELTHAEQWRALAETALTNLKNESGQDVFSVLHASMNQVNHLKTHTQKLHNCAELINNALIQLEEATSDLQNFKETLQLDPNQLANIEARLTQIYNLARKHRVQAQSLLEHQQLLIEEATRLSTIQTTLETLQKQLNEAGDVYMRSAILLSKSRQKAALQLEKLITKSLHHLEMPNGRFKIECTSIPFGSPTALDNITQHTMSAYGLDQIEFLVSTNPGHPLQPLRKIASGGELSRISLAIQVITAQKMTTPTLVFDEVDAGISGKTAETVGKLLKKLSKEAQVLCVTHLPQIAALGHQHYKVEKNQTQENTTTQIYALENTERILEIARMLGGANISQQAVTYAKEMLETV
jgi:DNA repair protein RecN (Recombination protein N)